MRKIIAVAVLAGGAAAAVLPAATSFADDAPVVSYSSHLSAVATGSNQSVSRSQSFSFSYLGRTFTWGF